MVEILGVKREDGITGYGVSMREARFRVWDTIQKQMYYPEKAKFCLTMIGRVCDDWTDDEGGKLENVDYRMIPLFFTGLKDKNGVEIYEGDIVTFPLEDYDTGTLTTMEWKIGWNNKEAFFNMVRRDDTELMLDVNMEYVEVIGNIYENPELLGEEKK